MMNYNVYISKVKKHLRLDEKTRKRVIEDLKNEIQLALDNGESIEKYFEPYGA
jgi:nucleoid DNA-binding protein